MSFIFSAWWNGDLGVVEVLYPGWSILFSPFGLMNRSGIETIGRGVDSLAMERRRLTARRLDKYKLEVEHSLGEGEWSFFHILQRRVHLDLSRPVETRPSSGPIPVPWLENDLPQVNGGMKRWGGTKVNFGGDEPQKGLSSLFFFLALRPELSQSTLRRDVW